MTKKQKAIPGRILPTPIIHVPMAVADHMGMPPAGLGTRGRLAVYLIPYALIGWDIVYRALHNMRSGQVFDENFLMTVATFGASGIGEHSEAVTVMLSYQIGELFQSYAVDRSRQSITELMDICPEYANIEGNGQLKQVDPDDIQVGNTTMVKAGRRIPLNNKVVLDDSMVDISALTGESAPRKVSVEDDVISGCVNGDGFLRVQVIKKFDNSTVAKIPELVENASGKEAQVESFITRPARYYTSAVVVDAAILAVLLPPVFGQSWAEQARRVYTSLIISCPCVPVISVPMSFFSGIGAVFRRGVLIKGSNYLEALSEMNTIVSDETETLTKGESKMTEIHAAAGTQKSLLKLAALAESYSDHPISRSIRETRGHVLDMNRISDTEETSGRGVKAVIDGHVVLADNSKPMKGMKVEYAESPSVGIAIYIAMDGTFYGSIIMSDTIKEKVYEAIRGLKQVGVERTIMLIGDKKEVGETVAARLGLDEVHVGFLPDGRVAKVEGLLAELKGKDKLAFVGGGIDDASVLSRADIGTAMGSMEFDAAIEAADMMLMDDDPSETADVVRMFHRAMTIIKQSIIFALGVKAIVFLMGAFDMTSMWGTILADVGMSVIAIVNAMRTLSL